MVDVYRQYLTEPAIAATVNPNSNTASGQRRLTGRTANNLDDGDMKGLRCPSTDWRDALAARVPTHSSRRTIWIMLGAPEPAIRTRRGCDE